MSMHNATLSTSTCNILSLADEHVSPCVNNVWTLLCEHAFVNCFFKSIVPCMSMHKESLSTCTCTTLPLAYDHVSPSMNTAVWTLLCEHYCVNIHLWIVSLKALYHACPCTKQVYLHLHVLHCHLHITMFQNLWTICEHYCVNMHLWIVSLNPLYPLCPFVIDVYLHVHVLHCHLHITMCYLLWTLCEHYCVNMHLWIFFFKHIVPCMCMYMYRTVTWILTCVSICYHVAKCVNVLTCMYACISMYIMTVFLIIKELVIKVKVSRSLCMYTCVLTLP